MTRPNGPVAVPGDYACPICTGGGGVFVHSQPAGAAICEFCAVDLSHFLKREEPADDFVIARLTAFTGESFMELRRRYYREATEFLRAKLSRDNLHTEVTQETLLTGRTPADTEAHWRAVLAEYEAVLRTLEPGHGA